MFTVITSVVLAGGNQRDPVLSVTQLADGVYALIGPTTERDAENLGNNANFGVILTEDGVILVDPGATYQGARMIDDTIRAITDLPVTMVINTGGQDHRWLGNAYFKSRGARIVANEKAVADQRERLSDQLARLSRRVGNDGLEGTVPVYADETFVDQEVLNSGGTRIELQHAGHAHTPGDSFVWLPDQKILFSGDIVYVDRMLRIGAHSAHRSWIQAFEALADKQPLIVVPGHGKPTSLAAATRDTYDYLVFLRESVQSLLEDERGMEAVGEIDQSRFAYLDNYEALKGRNVQRVYEEMEWE